MANPWGIAKEIGRGFMSSAGLEPMNKQDYVNAVNSWFSTPQKVEESSRRAAQPLNIVEAYAPPKPNVKTIVSVKPTQVPALAPSPYVAIGANRNDYKNHGMTTPQQAGFPALHSMPNQAEFENMFRKAHEMQTSDYGKVAGSAVIKDAKSGMVLAKGLGEATGGFSRPSTWRENLAAEESFYRDSADREDRQAAAKNAELKNDLMYQMNDAILRNQYDKADAASKALQAMSGIAPIDVSKTMQADTARLGLPSEIASREATAFTAMEGAKALPQMNAIKAATAMAEARSRLDANNAKYLDAALKSGDPNAIMALGTMPQFKNYVAAYMAAQQMSKE